MHAIPERPVRSLCFAGAALAALSWPDPRAARSAEPVAIEVRVYFAANSAVPPRGSGAALDAVAAVLVAHPEVTELRIDGHADLLEARPEELGLERARTVRRLLVGRGIEAGRLTFKSFGATKPANDRVSHHRALNRRVEFTVVAVHPDAGQ